MSQSVAAAPTDAPTAEPGPRTPALLEYISVVAFFLVVAGLGYRIVQGSALLGIGWVLLTAAVGYVGADLVSGLVHWGFDTWGSRTTPLVGSTFIVPFRMHHDDPMDITRHGFIATNGHNCFVSLLVLIPVSFLPVTWGFSAPIQSFVLFMCMGVFATNQFHKWAHEVTPSPLVAWLQRWHIVLGKEHHQVHHTFPYFKHYCITTGWLNRPLDAMGFFRGLEWAIEKVTGTKPRTDDLGHTPPPAQQA